MSDIDFDELDKAVNNLMGGVKDKDKEPDPNTVNIDSTLDPNEKPSFDKLNDATKEISGSPETPAVAAAPEQPKPTPAPVAQRPKQNPGRFMDVVHPSADMRTQSGAPAPTAPVRPLSGATSDEANPPAGGADEAETDPQTPFLPDANAKVSKRPLGAGSWPFGGGSEETADEPKQEELPEVSEPQQKPDETVAINSEGEPERKKEELGLDELPPDPMQVDAVPTDEDVKLQSIESMEVEGIPEEDESKELIQKVESGDTESLRSHGDTKDEKKHKKADEPEAASGAIYDVKNYHQPLAHPPKQKSGWGTVIIILSIIVICIAIGAAVFFVMGGGI